MINQRVVRFHFPGARPLPAQAKDVAAADGTMAQSLRQVHEPEFEPRSRCGLPPLADAGHTPLIAHQLLSPEIFFSINPHWNCYFWTGSRAWGHLSGMGGFYIAP